MAHAISEPDSEIAPISAPEQRHHKLGCSRRLVAKQLDRGDRAGGAATHAVIDRDHLRHGRHRDFLAGPPGDAATHDKRDDAEADIDHQMRLGGRADIEDVEEAGQDGDQHAEAGDEDPRRRSHRRRHALEAIHEQEGGREIGDANDELGNAGHRHVGSSHSPSGGWLSRGCDLRGGFACPLVWNIASIRSVTA